MSYFTYPPTTATGSGVPTYATFAAFPSASTAGNGALAIALDTDTLYISDGTTWHAIGSPSTVLNIGTYDSGVPSSNGAHISGNSLIMQSASTANPGEVNTGTQTFAGDKTFTGNISAANLSGQNTGDASVVYRPGGSAGGVVYTDWPSLYAAIVGLDIAHVYVCFDNSIEPIVIPAGTYSLPNVFFEAALGTSVSTPVMVTLDDGCVFTAFPGVSSLITMISISTTPVFVIPTSSYLIGLQLTGVLKSTSGAPMIQVPSGVALNLILLSDSTVSGEAGFPLIQLVGSASMLVLLSEATNFGDNTVSGGPGSEILYVVESANVIVSSTQTDFSGTSITGYNSTVGNIVFGNGLGDLVYAGANTTGTILSADTSNIKKFLTETSVAGSPRAPVWSTISSGDLPPVTSTTVTNVSNNASYFPTLITSSSTGNYALDVAAGINFNPSTNKLSTTSLNLSSLTASQAVVTDASKNLVSLAYISTNSNSTIVSRDSNGNSAFNNVIQTVTSTATSGQTIAMNAGSSFTQITTGTANITFNLPDSTTLIAGWSFVFNNNGTAGTFTINLHDGTTLLTTLPPGGIIVVDNLTNGTANGTWDTHAFLAHVATSGTSGTSFPGSVTAATQLISSVATGTAPLVVSSTTQVANLNVALAGNVTGTVVVGNGGTGITSGTSGGILGFTGSTTIASSAALTNNQVIVGGGAGATPKTLAAGTAGQYLQMNATPIPAWYTIPSPTVQKFTTGSGTYTTPAGVVWLQVKIVGGGGGGSGGGSSAGTGGTGGNSTFGTSLLTANGGPGGVWNSQPGSGGTASLSAPAVGVAIQGGGASPGPAGFTPANGNGGMGASSPFGGAGGGSYANNVGVAAVANTGSGGGGGGSSVTGNPWGQGGAAGGYIEAIIPATLSASYSYAVGAAGTAGTAGGSGFAGGAGGSGFIIVFEHYS
jgi:hypothetical protein